MPRGGGVQMREEGVGGESAGDLAGGGSAHAVADDVGASLRCSGAGVLIAMADAAAVGEHGVDKVVRRHCWVVQQSEQNDTR